MTVTCPAGVADEHIGVLDRRVDHTTGSSAGSRTDHVGGLEKLVLSTWRRDKGAGRTATLLTVSSALALNLTVALLVHSAFPGLRFTPWDEAPPVASAPGPSVADIAQRTGKTPAEVVVSLVLATPPALPAGAQPVSALQGVPSSAVDLVCGTGTGPGPVTAGGRGWTVGNGSQVTNFQAGYTVTVSAYGAGQGAVAFNALAGQVNDHCANRSGTAYLVGSTGTGVDAATARVNRSGAGTTAFFWRRGDVVAMVASAGRSGPMNMVKEYDARLAAALAGVCATNDSSAADAARSPYVNRAGFTGLINAAPVGLPVGVPAPARVAAPAVVDLPDVSLPDQPAFPFWPERLPTPVPAPTAPVLPDYPALTTTAPMQVLDGQGPGCGWAFTGQPVPNFDAAAAASKAAVDAGRAADTLGANAASYAAAVRPYGAAYTLYLADVRAFQTYARALDTVAAAWKVIRLDQAEYQEALAFYTAALAARDLFLARQATARTTYATALDLCAGRIPTPTTAPPTPPATVPTSAPTGPGPTATPTTPPLVCPPVPAPIITQTAPPTPTQPPPPPADPRPTP